MLCLPERRSRRADQPIATARRPFRRRRRRRPAKPCRLQPRRRAGHDRGLASGRPLREAAQSSAPSAACAQGARASHCCACAKRAKPWPPRRREARRAAAPAEAAETTDSASLSASDRQQRQDRHERQQRVERQGQRVDRQGGGPAAADRAAPRQGRPGRTRRARAVLRQAARRRRDRRDKQPDPNSPFAKLAALKQQLEQNTKEQPTRSGRSRRHLDRQRIDKWLWHARMVRTRSDAAALARSGLRAAQRQARDRAEPPGARRRRGDAGARPLGQGGPGRGLLREARGCARRPRALPRFDNEFRADSQLGLHFCRHSPKVSPGNGR